MRTQVGVHTTVLAGLLARGPARMPGVGVCNRDGNQHHRAWQQWRDEAVGSDRNQRAFPVLDAGLWARRRTCLSGNLHVTGHADVHVSTLLRSALLSLGVPLTGTNGSLTDVVSGRGGGRSTSLTIRTVSSTSPPSVV